MIEYTIPYSVCVDCLMFVANGDVEHENETPESMEVHVKRELGGKPGGFATGVEQTEEDPDGTGDEAFSNADCELCMSHLAGSRHGVTLLFHTAEQTPCK